MTLEIQSEIQISECLLRWCCQISSQTWDWIV